MSSSAEKMTAQKAWRVLGVAANSSLEDAKVAYHKLCLTRHPDKPEGSDESFKTLKNAWDFITKNVFRKDGSRIEPATRPTATGWHTGPTRPKAHLSTPPTAPPGAGDPRPRVPRSFGLGEILTSYPKDGAGSAAAGSPPQDKAPTTYGSAAPKRPRQEDKAPTTDGSAAPKRPRQEEEAA